MLPNIPTALGADERRRAAATQGEAAAARSRPPTGRSTPRINPYLQDLEPTVPMQAAASMGAHAPLAVALALEDARRFRPPSAVEYDRKGNVVVASAPSRPMSAASSDSIFSQANPLALHRKEFMKPMAVRLTPIGAIFDVQLDSARSNEDSMMVSDSMLDEAAEAYLDDVLADPVPREHAHMRPVTPSSPPETSETEESEENKVESEPELLSSGDEYEAVEAAEPLTVVPGLGIEINLDALAVSGDLAGHVERWQHAITKALDHEGILAEVEHVSGRVPGVVLVEVIFRNTLAGSQAEANSFSRMPSGASTKSTTGKGWAAIKRAGSGAARQIIEAGGMKRIESIVRAESTGTGGLNRVESVASATTGFVLKGSAAKRMRNDCMSRSQELWQESLPQFVSMRACQVVLILPRGPSLGLVPALTADAAGALKSLKVGVLVRAVEGAPPLGVLAAGARGGVGTVVSAVRGVAEGAAGLGRDDDSQAGHDARPWLVSVWWHETGLITQHSSHVSTANDIARIGSSGVPVRGVVGAEDDEASVGQWRSPLLGTDWLRPFARAVGVDVKAEPGLMVRPRGKLQAWAVEGLEEDGYIVSGALAADVGEYRSDHVQAGWHQGAAGAPADDPGQQHCHSELDSRPHRRRCYVIWKSGYGGGPSACDTSPPAEASGQAPHSGVAPARPETDLVNRITPGHAVLTRLKDLTVLKVPNARLAALLQRPSQEMLVVSTADGQSWSEAGESCAEAPLCLRPGSKHSSRPPTRQKTPVWCCPRVGLRVRVSRSAYLQQASLVAASADGPGIIVGVIPSASGPRIQPSDSAFPHTWHALLVAWVRTDKKVQYETSVIKRGFLVAAEDERLVGSALHPAKVGMRVRLVDRLRFLQPILFADSAGGPGTLSWVSPWDPDGQDKAGLVCQVVWDWTGVRECYSTGFKGQHMLRLLDATAMRNHKELFLGADVDAVVGQRIRVSSAARVLMPSLCRGSEPMWGCGTVQRVLDLETSPLARHLMLRNSDLHRQHKRSQGVEKLVGIDVAAQLGQRVMLAREARRRFVHSSSHGQNKPEPERDPAQRRVVDRVRGDASTDLFCAGTVVAVGQGTSVGGIATCPFGTVLVKWDNGHDAGREAVAASLHNQAHLHNVGREGKFELSEVRDQVLVGGEACPLALDLRVVLSRRLVAHDTTALLDSGDGPGQILSIVDWPPLVAEEGPTAETQIDVGRQLDEDKETDEADDQSTDKDRVPTAEDSEVRSEAQEVNATAKVEEPTTMPRSGEVMVRWDKTGRVLQYKCGVDQEFSLALWQGGRNWRGHMCEVRWDVTEVTSAFAFERGYVYKHTVGGLQTREDESNRLLPLVLAEDKPDVNSIVLQLVDVACTQVELERTTQQKAATLMQKLARGVWGRRRIRRLRVVASSREVLRLMHGQIVSPGATCRPPAPQTKAVHLDLSAMLKRRQAYPPFSFQWRLLVLMHRVQELMSSPDLSAAVARETSRLQQRHMLVEEVQAFGRASSAHAKMVEDMSAAAKLLTDDELHATDKLQGLLRLTQVMTHAQLAVQQQAQNLAVSMGLISSLLEAVMGIVASEPPADETKASGSWAALLLSGAMNNEANKANVSKEMEEAVETLQHAAALALAQLALRNRAACHALLGAGCLQVVALLLEHLDRLHEHFKEALVGILNNMCCCSPIAARLAMDTCPGLLHHLVLLLHPPRDPAQEEEETQQELDDYNAVHTQMSAIEQASGRMLRTQFKVPRVPTNSDEDNLAVRPLTPLQGAALMALSTMAARDAECRLALSSCGMVPVLEALMPHLRILQAGAYAPVRWSQDRRLPEEAMAVFLYLSVKSCDPHPQSLIPPPTPCRLDSEQLALVVLDAANDWLSSFTDLGAAGTEDCESGEGKLIGTDKTLLKRVPSAQGSNAGVAMNQNSGGGWAAVRRASSVGKLSEQDVPTLASEKLGWTLAEIELLSQRVGGLPPTRAHAPLLSLTRHATSVEKDKSLEGFGRAASGGSAGSAGFSRAASFARVGSGASLSRQPSIADPASKTTRFHRASSFGRKASGESVVESVQDAALAAGMARLHALKLHPEQYAARGIVCLDCLPVPIYLGMALVRLCGLAETRTMLHQNCALNLMAKLLAHPNVGPCARRLMVEAILLLTYNVSADAPAAPLVQARDMTKEEDVQLLDQDAVAENMHAEVFARIFHVETLTDVRQHRGLSTFLAAVCQDPSLLEHKALLAKHLCEVGVGGTSEADGRLGAREGVQLMPACSGEADKNAAEDPETSSDLVRLFPTRAAVMEELGAGGDEMLQEREDHWASESVCSTLSWQANELSGNVYEAISSLHFLVRDCGHLMLVAAADAGQEVEALAQQLVTQHLVVWGQGDEKITGLVKDDRTVDKRNRLIPLPPWLSLGVGAASALVVVWTPRVQLDVRFVAQVAYARCLGKPLVLIERCAQGLTVRRGHSAAAYVAASKSLLPTHKDQPAGLGEEETSRLGSRRASMSSEESGASSNAGDEVGQPVNEQAAEAGQQCKSDALHVDDQMGRYAVVGVVQARYLGESEAAPQSLIAVSMHGSSILWPTLELGKCDEGKRSKPDKMLVLKDGADLGRLDKPADVGNTAGTDTDSGAGEEQEAPKRMAVGFDEIAAAAAAARVMRAVQEAENARAKEELDALAEEIKDALGGYGSVPGPLVAGVSAPDVRVVSLGKRALIRAQSAAGSCEPQTDPCSPPNAMTTSDAGLLREDRDAALPRSQSPPLLVSHTPSQSARHAASPVQQTPDEDETEDVGAAEAEEHALAADLAAATGLRPEQIVLLGILKGSGRVSVCFALLHMSCGGFGRSLVRLRNILALNPSDHRPNCASASEARCSSQAVNAPDNTSEGGAGFVEVEGDDAHLKQRLCEHWGVRAPCVVMHQGQGQEADALADMMTALERRLARAAMVECRKQAGLIAARLVADTQIRALRAVSEKLGVRFREPGKPRLYLHLYDRQEELGEIYMNLEDADWHRVQAVIQRNFSRAADIGYYASANLDEEELRVLQRQTKTRRGVTQVWKPPLHLSPAHSKPARLVRVYNKRTFLIFMTLCKTGQVYAMDPVGGVKAVTEVAGDDLVWEDGAIDVRAHVHMLWLDKAPEPLYLGHAPQVLDMSGHVPASPAGISRATSPLASSPLSSRPVTGQASLAASGRAETRPVTGFSGKAQLIKLREGALPPQRLGSQRRSVEEDWSERSLGAMTGQVLPVQDSRHTHSGVLGMPQLDASQPGGANGDAKAEASGRPMTQLNRLRSRRSARDVGAGRLGTAASGLYREMSSSQALGSFAGAAGLLMALDTFPTFNEPRAARLPPSKRQVLLRAASCDAQQRIEHLQSQATPPADSPLHTRAASVRGSSAGSSQQRVMLEELHAASCDMVTTVMQELVADLPSNASSTRSTPRQQPSGASGPLPRPAGRRVTRDSRLSLNRRVHSSGSVKPGYFGSYRNLLADSDEFELSMVSRVEASSVLNDTCGPEKALDGRSDTRWASDHQAAGAYLVIHLKNTCLLSLLKIRQATTTSGGSEKEWASVVQLVFSDDSHEELVLDTSQETAEDEQVFEFRPRACEWVRISVNASHGNRGAAFTDIRLFGYDACNESLLVRAGEKIQAALTAVMAGGLPSGATVWIAQGTYYENLEIMCPVTLVALSPQPPIICSLDDTKPAITCGVPGIYLHGLALLQASWQLSSACDGFAHDRLAPGTMGAHWSHEATIKDHFGEYTGFVSQPQDTGTSMGAWERIKTIVEPPEEGLEEKLRELATQFPVVLADVVRYEEILAAFEEGGQDTLDQLRLDSTDLKLHKQELKKEEVAVMARVAEDRRAFHDMLKLRGDDKQLGLAVMQAEMLQAQDRAAKIKSNQVKDEVAEIEARLEFLRARLAARAEPNGADAQIGPQGLEAADDEREKAEAELQKARYRWEQAMQDAAEVALELQKHAEVASHVLAGLILEDILQSVHEEAEVAPELAALRAEIHDLRQQRKSIKERMKQVLAETEDASAKVHERVQAVEAMRRQLEPCALYVAYGGEVVVTRCRLRSARGSGIVAGPRALAVARGVSITHCGRHGVLCHNGGRIVLDSVSILHCRQYGALALHANLLPTAHAQARQDDDGSGGSDHDTAEPSSADAAGYAMKPKTPKTPNMLHQELRPASPLALSRAGTGHLDSRPKSRASGRSAGTVDVDLAPPFEKRVASTVHFGPPAIVARKTTMAYNGVAGVAGDSGAELELDACGLFSNRREGLVLSGEGTLASVRELTAASNGAQGIHVKMHALAVAKNSSILGNGQHGCLVAGHHSTLKLHGGTVQLNGLEGVEIRSGGLVALRAHALVHRNYRVMPSAAQARVEGAGSWLDVEASTVGDAAQAYPAHVACENGGRAHLHWPPQLEVVQDPGAEAEGSYKLYRKDGRSLTVDQGQTLVAGEQPINIKCHAGPDLGSPVVREFVWVTSAAACNPFELSLFVRKAVQAQDSAEASLPRRQRKPPLMLPSAAAAAWRLFYTERASRDLSVGYEGDLIGPLVKVPIWDVLPHMVSLHLFPNDKAGPEAKRQEALEQRRTAHKLAQVAHQRELERESKLSRMYPEQRDAALLDEQNRQERRRRHLLHMRRVRAEKEGRLHAPIPQKQTETQVRTGYGERWDTRSLASVAPNARGSTLLDALSARDATDWVAMTEDVSGDTYWWNVVSGDISWADPSQASGVGRAGLGARADSGNARGQVDGQEAKDGVKDAQADAEDDEALRAVWTAARDKDASEQDLRAALQRLKTPGASMPSYHDLHRII